MPTLIYIHGSFVLCAVEVLAVLDKMAVSFSLFEDAKREHTELGLDDSPEFSSRCVTAYYFSHCLALFHCFTTFHFPPILMNPFTKNIERSIFLNFFSVRALLA